jgi:hypothetical protein
MDQLDRLDPLDTSVYAPKPEGYVSSNYDLACRALHEAQARLASADADLARFYRRCGLVIDGVPHLKAKDATESGRVMKQVAELTEARDAAASRVQRALGEWARAKAAAGLVK